jgi:Bacterial transcriptional activator domain
VQRLDDERVQASEQRLGLAVRHGDVAAAVIELQALVDAEPWRELGFPEYWNKKRRSFATHWIY